MAGPGLALLAACALGFAATDAPRLRYATLPEHRREILERSGPIDVLVLGTSRSHRGVSAKALRARLPGEGGAPPVVVNLGRPFRGDGQIHRMLRDLLERRPVRRVVLYELTHHPDRESYYHYYGNNEITVTFRDLVGALRYE